MGLAEWLASFRDLHEQHKKSTLSSADQATYLAGREELARAVLAAQHLTAPNGETKRRALRAARALQADVDLDRGSERVMTLEIGAGGFGALFAKAPPVGEEVRFSLRVPGGGDPIVGWARIVDVKVLPGNARASFAFTRLEEAERERLEVLVFDTVLSHLVVP
jgi:hypothetical protein